MNIENLDDIKSSWQQANAPLSSMAGETLRESRKALLRRGSAQDKLAAQYRRMACAAAAGLAVWLFAVLTMLDFVAWARPWLAVATVVFFVTSGVMDLWLCRAVRRIDLAAWPVSAVALEVAACCACIRYLFWCCCRWLSGYFSLWSGRSMCRHGSARG